MRTSDSAFELAAFGRLLPFTTLIFYRFERPLSAKAAIQISMLENSCRAAALHPKAAVEVVGL